MTDIDTAAIRANLDTWCENVAWARGRIEDLCDALDAAEDDLTIAVRELYLVRARMEAALALLERGSGEPIEAVRRALTGDTSKHGYQAEGERSP